MPLHYDIEAIEAEEEAERDALTAAERAAVRTAINSDSAHPYPLPTLPSAAEIAITSALHNTYPDPTTTTDQATAQTEQPEPHPQPGSPNQLGPNRTSETEPSDPYFLPFWPSTGPDPRQGDPLTGLSYAPDFADAIQPTAFGAFEYFYNFPIVVQVLPDDEGIQDSEAVLIPDLEAAEDMAPDLYFDNFDTARERLDTRTRGWGWFVHGGELRSGVGRVVGVFVDVRVPWVDAYHTNSEEGEGSVGGRTEVATDIWGDGGLDGDRDGGEGVNGTVNGDAVGDENWHSYVNGDSELGAAGLDRSGSGSELFDQELLGERVLWHYRDRVNIALRSVGVG